ncbi:aldo/keto reductase [Bryobacter aggregatus]|uniref:aldo/keto reductase n=1 Tax=Bryobacter aggregatus TaxID=360054 RepID=UPI0004E1C913|nr:aldo/keto reductase [Bryobacter aggregatus]
MLTGFATPEGTAHFAARFPQLAAQRWFQTVNGLMISNLGLGSYLGQVDEEADRLYQAATEAALVSGINFIDTARNYRHGQSEIALGKAIVAHGHREEIVVATKAGFTSLGHSMEPAFLEEQLDLSRKAMGLETIDIFYLHNPETQLRNLSPDEFETALAKAFEKCEALVASGRIRSYGTATWDGYRVPGMLDLDRVKALAGPNFGWIQLPLNAVLTEGAPVAEKAAAMGLGVVASATIYQGRLREHLPVAIQYSRYSPGVTSALVGMGRPEHVAANLAAAVAEIG